MLYPEPDSLPYEYLAPDPVKEQQRLQVLASLKSCLEKTGDGPALIVTPAIAVVRKTLSTSEFTESCHTIKQGMTPILWNCFVNGTVWVMGGKTWYRCRAQ